MPAPLPPIEMPPELQASYSPVSWLLLTQPKILHPTQGYIPFVPRAYQRRALYDWEQPARLILKSRQLGFSQAFAAEAYWKATYRGPRRILVVSRKEESAKEFLGYVSGLCAPGELKTDNATSLEWPNGSRIKIEAATKSAGRSFAASDVYLDEFGHAPWALDIYQAVRPTIATGGSITVFSSPNGRANVFYQLWSGMLGQEQWRRYKYDWRWLWDEAWAERERAGMTAQQFATEYGCDFVNSADAPFDEADVQACFNQPSAPSQRQHLLVSVDVAGRGKDATVVYLWDLGAKPVRMLRHWRWTEGPFERLYQLLGQIRDEYPNCHEWWIDDTGMGDPVVEEAENRVGRGRVTPFVFTHKSKEEAITAAQHMLQQHAVSFDDPQLRTELMLYQRDDAALVTDCVMAFCIMAIARVGHHVQRAI